MENLDLKNIKGELPEKLLEKLIKIYHKADKSDWRKVYGELTDKQSRQVLDEVTARRRAKQEEEYAKKSPKEQQAYDDALYRAGGLHYARDGYYLTIYLLHDMVHRQGAYLNSSLDNVKKITPKLYEKVMARRAYMTQSENFMFFSSNRSFLANAFPAKFELDGLQFYSALHYMIYAKAELFRDRRAMKLLTQGRYPTSDLLRLGKKIKLFKKIVWDMKVGDFLETALRAKFTQNEDLKKQLFDTQGKTLVLSCAKDKVWGIGLSEEEAKDTTRENWQGKNLLGETLTSLRIELMGEY